MEAKALLHTTKNVSRPLFGHRLEAGDKLEATDMYDSTGGDWQPCPMPGLTLQAGNAAVWVRPAVGPASVG